MSSIVLTFFHFSPSFISNLDDQPKSFEHPASGHFSFIKPIEGFGCPTEVCDALSLREEMPEAHAGCMVRHNLVYLFEVSEETYADLAHLKFKLIFCKPVSMTTNHAESIATN